MGVIALRPFHPTYFSPPPLGIIRLRRIMSEPNQQKQLTAIVHGYVQGVSFRYHTHRAANRLGVTGWVANQRDGTVKVVAEGDEAALRQLVAFLHEGSPAAHVQRVEEKWTDATGEFSRFSVNYLG